MIWHSKIYRDIMTDNNFYLRDILANSILDIGKKDESVVIVNADLMKTCRNNNFVESFPERAFNVGIAEQNMVSFAAGLSHEGFKPYVFSMAPFLSMRACEQVRTDVAYANADVTMIAPYSGLSGGISGATHWGIEDCGIMQSIPNMIVMEPSDPIQAKAMIDASLEHEGPIYIRNTVEPVPIIYDSEYHFEIGKASIVLDGDDACIVASGITVKYAIEAAIKLLSDTGRKVMVIDMHTIKPIDKNAVINAAKTGNIVVAQDHNVIGGLGSAVAMAVAESGISTKFKVLGVNDKFVPMAHAPYLYSKFGYDTTGIYQSVIDGWK